MTGLDLRMVDNGSVKIPQVFNDKEFKFLTNLVDVLLDNTDLDHQVGIAKESKHGHGQYFVTRCIYIDELMVKIQPKIELISGYKLLPKNHYLRVHTEETKGWPLMFHTDGCGNDINLTINISNEPQNKDWPIYVADYDANVSEYTTDCNEGVVYDGIYPHWRNAFPGGTYKQLFLHYTRKDNPHANWCRWNSRIWGHVSDVDPEVARETLNPFCDYKRVIEMYPKVKHLVDEVDDWVIDND